MIERVLQVESQGYPFEKLPAGQAVRVEEKHVFALLSDLLQKKREVGKKAKLLESSYLIRLVQVCQDELTLRFVYEYVPYSLANFLPRKLAANPLCGRSLIKKLNFDLTMLISYLAAMRIELDLSLHSLGLTEQNRLKVFMGARCRMGHKSELSLIAHYGHCRERIVAFLEAQLQQPPPEAPNFVIRGNKLVFPKKDLNESLYSQDPDPSPKADSQDTSTLRSGIFASSVCSGVGNLSTASCINPNVQPEACRLRHTQSPRFGRSLNFSEAKDVKGRGRNHKNSFQFGAGKGNPQKFYTEDDDNSDAKSFTHSRSIRIEFQQKFDPSARKKRKDSCKLKITTFHEYEMDDVTPQDLFAGRQEHFFGKFAQKGEQERCEFSKQQPASELFSKKRAGEAMRVGEGMHSPSASSARASLEEKVRLARERAEGLLSRFVGRKK